MQTAYFVGEQKQYGKNPNWGRRPVREVEEKCREWSCRVESGQEWETRPLGERCLLKRSGSYGQHTGRDHVTRRSRVSLKLCQQQKGRTDK